MEKSARYVSESGTYKMKEQCTVTTPRRLNMCKQDKQHITQDTSPCSQEKTRPSLIWLSDELTPQKKICVCSVRLTLHLCSSDLVDSGQSATRLTAEHELIQSRRKYWNFRYSCWINRLEAVVWCRWIFNGNWCYASCYRRDSTHI